jgi:cobalt-zinc-cadmium efflux system outer membrane protein
MGDGAVLHMEVHIMKSILVLMSGATILAACFGGFPWPAAQAQEIETIAPFRQPPADVPPLPDDFGPPAGILPVPSPEEVPSGNREILRIADLEAIALGNNPTIAQAQSRVGALQGKYVQVGLRPNPTIGYEGEEMGDEGTAGQQGMFIGQRFVTGGKLGLNRAVVSHEIQRAQQALEIQRLRVINAVRGRAYNTIAAQRIVALNERLVAIGEEGVKAADEMRRAKEVSQVDVLQARVEANSAKLALNNARNEHKAAWQRLAVVTGVPELEPKPLMDDLGESVPELHWNDVVGRLLAESPELAGAWAGMERAKCALARAQAGRKPDVDVEAAVRYNNSSESTTATIGVGLPRQIFDRNQGNISKAYCELAAAQREVRRVELVLQDRLAEVFRQYTNARQQTQQYKTEILPDAESSLDLVRKGYQQGEFGYLELLTAQRTYFRVNLAYLESLRELWLSTVQIEGLLLTGGLERPGSK